MYEKSKSGPKKKVNSDPMYLQVGTPVSAKYRGAFCEATVEKVDKQLKCRIQYKESNVIVSVSSDDIISGELVVNGEVEIHGNDGRTTHTAVVIKVIDHSSYNVVFDDGDKRTLKRTQLVLKGDRHFKESESLDRLPLTNPEQFKNPVINGKRRKTRFADGESETDEDSSAEGDTDSHTNHDNQSEFTTPIRSRGHRSGWSNESRKPNTPTVNSTPANCDYPSRLASYLGQLVLVTLPAASSQSGNTPSSMGDKKKVFPALVVLSSASVEHDLKHSQLLVRSFKDNKFFAVLKREISPLSRDQSIKFAQSNKLIRSAVERAVLWIDNRELPTNWDKDVLLGPNWTCSSSATSSPGNVSKDNSRSKKEDSDDTEDEEEELEEKDHWIAMLYKFMDEHGSPINKAPSLANKDLDLYKLNKLVHNLGGYSRVTSQMKWPLIYSKMGLPSATAGPRNIQTAYRKYLLPFDDMNRKLGSSSFHLQPMSSARNTSASQSRHFLTARERRASCIEASSTPLSDKRRTSGSPVKESLPVREQGCDEISTSLLPRELPLPSIIAMKDEETCPAPVSPQPVKRRKRQHREVVAQATTATATRTRGGKKGVEPSLVAEDDREDETLSSTCSHGGGSSLGGDDPTVPREGSCVGVRYGGDEVVYDAKIVRKQCDTAGQIRYTVHYLGWNSRHDEVVHRDRIVVLDETNFPISKRKCMDTPRSSGNSASGSTKSASITTTKTECKKEEDAEDSNQVKDDASSTSSSLMREGRRLRREKEKDVEDNEEVENVPPPLINEEKEETVTHSICEITEDKGAISLDEKIVQLEAVVSTEEASSEVVVPPPTSKRRTGGRGGCMRRGTRATTNRLPLGETDKVEVVKEEVIEEITIGDEDEVKEIEEEEEVITPPPSPPRTRRGRRISISKQESVASSGSNSEAESNGTCSTVRMLGATSSPVDTHATIISSSIDITGSLEETMNTVLAEEISSVAVETEVQVVSRGRRGAGSGGRSGANRRDKQTVADLTSKDEISSREEESTTATVEEDTWETTDPLATKASPLRKPGVTTTRKRRASLIQQQTTTSGHASSADSPARMESNQEQPMSNSSPHSSSCTQAIEQAFVRAPDRPFVRIHETFYPNNLEEMEPDVRVMELQKALRKINDAWRKMKQELRDIDRRRLKRRSKFHNNSSVNTTSSGYSPKITQIISAVPMETS